MQAYKDLQEAILDYKKAYSDINVGSSTLADMSKKVDDLKQAWQEAESKILSGGKAVRENSDYMQQASAVTDEYAKKTRDLGESIENSNSGSVVMQILWQTPLHSLLFMPLVLTI